MAQKKEGCQWPESCTTQDIVNIEKGVRGLVRPTAKNLDVNEVVQDFLHQPTNVIFYSNFALRFAVHFQPISSRQTSDFMAAEESGCTLYSQGLSWTKEKRTKLENCIVQATGILDRQ